MKPLRTVASVAEAAAALFVEHAKKSILERERFLVVLSGGSTPLAMYDVLLSSYRHEVAWERVLFFWGDERYVPYSDERSNFGVARECFLKHLPLLERHVHPWPYVPDRPEVAAASYASILREQAGTPLRFDLVLLGLGEDAHTASLFPGAEVLPADDLTAVVKGQAETRLSLTSAALSHGSHVVFLVAGESKRQALKDTLEQSDPERYPAQQVTALESLLFLTDLEL